MVSLDVFRGLTIVAMILVNNPGSWTHIYPPLRHAEWHGWTLADTVFPFFLLIVGVSIAFSFGSKLEEGVGKSSMYFRIVRRALILFALGLFLNAFPTFELSTIRIPGVLQRIAVCYLVTAVIFLHSGWKARLAWAAGLLIVYWAAMEWVPVPGIGAGVYEKEYNLAAWVDGRLLAGHMWQSTKTWDPEGILSTIPAVSTTLFGTLAGQWLRSDRRLGEKAKKLFLAGSAAALLGALWHIRLPINKSLWTGSYAVLMAGLASICLAAIYWITEIRGNIRWIKPFAVFGRNAIAVYVLAGIVARLLNARKVAGPGGDPVTLKSWIYRYLFASWLDGPAASLAFAIAFIVLMYICILPLHRKRIYIKI
jgi:predicted acyltransferase